MLGLAPNVFVQEPCIVGIAGGREIPHLYSQEKQQLCLYYPYHNEWMDTMYIADKLIPWVSLWLYYFEDWLFTDDWNGGGIHPS